LALGVTSEIYLLERMLRVGAAMVTSEFGDEYEARASQREHTGRSCG
jgi:hypothetical protein